MPARSPKAAVDAFVARHRLVATCVTDRILLATGSRPGADPHALWFAPPDVAVPLRMRHGRRGPSLLIRHDYVVTPAVEGVGFEVRTFGYWYQIYDAQDREIVGYHWHPIGRSPITTPHAHVSGSHGPIEIDLGEPASLSDAHLPTGPVALADIVRLLIAELGVTPRRPDWDAVLRRNRDAPTNAPEE